MRSAPRKALGQILLMQQNSCGKEGNNQEEIEENLQHMARDEGEKLNKKRKIQQTTLFTPVNRVCAQSRNEMQVKSRRPFQMEGHTMAPLTTPKQRMSQISDNAQAPNAKPVVKLVVSIAIAARL